MTKVVFMGTPEFAVPSLKSLLATQTVVGVVTQPDRPAGRGQRQRPSPVKEAAQAAGVPLYQPETLRPEETAAPIRAWGPDVIVVAAFGQILRPHLLDLPPRGCINVHASLLPRWRGASPIQYAIMAGDGESGITLMQMDEGLDTGPVFVQKAIPILPRETAATLHDRLAALGGEMLAVYLDDILAGRIPATPQDDSVSTYAPMIKKKDGRLTWSEPAVDLDRRIRAMTPWPGAFTFWGKKRLKVITAVPFARPLPAAPPGQVIAQPLGGEDAVVVQTGEAGLRLQKVQLAGKQAMKIHDFVRGRPDFVGGVLGKGN
jgi:methionyl-tRNA formyltransferase